MKTGFYRWLSHIGGEKSLPLGLLTAEKDVSRSSD
jgi:hypothetical protein